MVGSIDKLINNKNSLTFYAFIELTVKAKIPQY